MGNQVNKKSGFTLVEILMSVFIFTIIIATLSGIFVSSVRNQKRALSSEKILSETSYALEYMSRALRMAKKDSTGACITAGAGYNYENPGGDISKIRFIKYDTSQGNDVCYEFFLEDNKIKEKRSIDISDNFGPALSLTSNEIIISRFNPLDTLEPLRFKITGAIDSDIFQPKVTIFLEVKAAEGSQPPKLRIQTTVSQRNLDD